ncbi:hypothetical protein HFO56_03390 [Rhizobium laguerreae]|uniref:hypothetical protein n=1 Tax=Rhizobium laguerreae TaxID=1076926 RepID=UPI001C9143D9|nr:hypothetical protein [Rhizobium laguerreae]MBY3151432.1 hypothetical protein [Rhizobium laguerreae]
MKHQDHLKAISAEYENSYGFELPWQIPHYMPTRIGDWSVRPRLGGIGGSYLAHRVVEPPYTILYHGNDVWMSTSLIEVESHAWHLHCAKGNLLVAGLGLGMYLHAASMKADVRKIVVIESDPDVIALMKKSTDFEKWIHRDKITIIEADALATGTRDKVGLAFGGQRPDYLYADIWPVYPDPNAPAQTKSMIDLYKPHKSGWWGQEVEFGFWLEGRARDASLASLQDFFEDHEIDAPVHQGYLAFCRDAISVQLHETREPNFGAAPTFG